MGFLDLFKTGDRLNEMDTSVQASFAKVKTDTDALYQWVSYLYRKNQQLLDENKAIRMHNSEQKMALHTLKVTVSHLPKSHAEIKQIVDSNYDLDPVLRRIKHIEQKIELLEMKQAHAKARPLVHEQPSANHAPIVHKPREVQQVRQAPLREKLMRKLARNSKDYIKNLILGLVHKYGRIGALQLREMVVEEQGLCSKSSFYRILSEMESQAKLQVVSTGKHTIYVAPSHT